MSQRFGDLRRAVRLRRAVGAGVGPALGCAGLAPTLPGCLPARECSGGSGALSPALSSPLRSSQRAGLWWGLTFVTVRLTLRWSWRLGSEYSLGEGNCILNLC